MTKDGWFSYRQIFSYLGFLKQISWLYERDPNFSKQKFPTFITVVEMRMFERILCYVKFNLIFIARVWRSTVDKCERHVRKCMRLRLVVEDTEQRRRIVSITTRMAILGEQNV